MYIYNVCVCLLVIVLCVLPYCYKYNQYNGKRSLWETVGNVNCVKQGENIFATRFIRADVLRLLFW